jgi:glycosyltransferase involved in cell wall biosynthesis
MTSKAYADVTIILNIWKGDNPQYFDDSILSVTKQTLLPKVLLIVSDGPVMQSHLEIIERYRNLFSWISFVETKLHRGISAAKNEALSLVKTTYVAIHDADDIMHPDRIAIQFEYMIKSDVDISGTAMIEFNSENDVILGLRNFGPGEIHIGNFINNKLNNPTIMAKYEVFRKVGGYTDLYYMEDYFFLIKALKIQLKISNIEFPLTAFRITKDFYRRRRGRKFITAEFIIYQERIAVGLPMAKEFLILIARLAFRAFPPIALRGLYSMYRWKSPYRTTENNLGDWVKYEFKSDVADN